MDKCSEMLGLTFKSNNHGDAFIIDYKSCENILVMFYDGTIIKTTMYQLKRGCFAKSKGCEYEGKVYKFDNHTLEILKYVKHDEVYILIDNEYKVVDKIENVRHGRVLRNFLRYNDTYEEGVRFKIQHDLNKLPHFKRVYEIWSGIFKRCYPKSKTNSEKYIAYRDCYVSEEFHHFENFYNFCISQPNFLSIDDNGRYFEFDKDLLSKEKKRYSSETCTFIPVELNKFIIHLANPKGFRECDGKYDVRCYVDGKRQYLGRYNSESEAINVYKQYKLKQLQHLIDKYTIDITEKALTALKNLEIELDG